MVRRRWPDVVIVVGIVALVATGVLALWGETLRAWWRPAGETPLEQAPPRAGTT